MTIEIQVDEPFRSAVSSHQLESAVAATLAYENVLGDVTLIIGDDDAITDLNLRFLGNPGPTDVLSFPAQESDDAFVQAPDADIYLGDIIIAYPYAAAQAAQQGHSIMDELNLLAVHGTLHLLGYDHAEPEEKADMWNRQDAILSGMRSG
jgi:probable rRNA maturation factor